MPATRRNVPRRSLKFWPGTRHMVDDLVGIDPSNHGTPDAYAVCNPATAGCAPAFWQQRAGSWFLRALNAGQETYAGSSNTDTGRDEPFTWVALAQAHFGSRAV